MRFPRGVTVTSTLLAVAALSAETPKNRTNLIARNLPVEPRSAATQLVSGVSVPFSLSPVFATTLFNRDDSFLISVPSGASELRIQLVTTSPAGADVDLFARFGVDNDVSANTVVHDHSSTSALGNELIIITPASTPLLRTGLYYISMLVYTTGATITGTITATVVTGGGGGGGTTPTNLIVNGDAESGATSPTCSAVPSIPGWTTDGNVTVCSYSTGGGYPTATSPGPPNRGNSFFGGGGVARSALTQSIDVSSQSGQIDAGALSFTLSAYLGGFAADGDNATLSITFQNNTGTMIGSATLPGVTSADRQGVTGLLQRDTTGTVPIGTRTINVLLDFARLAGATNDGYADNILLTFGTGGGGGTPGGSGNLTVIVNQEDNSACPATKKLLVSVRDNQGQPVTGLTAGNFSLTENGTARPVTVNCQVSAGAAAVAASVAILIDSSGSLSATDLANEKAAAKQLVSSLGANDAIAVYSFDDAVTQRIDFTTNKVAANTAIDGIVIGGGTALYRALSDAAIALGIRTGRKAIVLMTDGQDSVGGTTLDQAVIAAQAAGAPVFTVGFGSGVNSSILTRIANDTGGFSSTSATSANLQQILQQIGQALASQCEISYTPSTPSAPATVTITVTSPTPSGTRTGLLIRQIVPCSTVGTPGTGCPSSTNIALNRPATQSSVALNGFANLGNNGIQESDYGFHTNLESAPYWQVDFGVQATLCELRLFNRTISPERARTISVLTSNDGGIFQVVYLHNGSVWGADGNPLVIPLNSRQARYLRLQLSEINFLHLKEVEVFGALGTGGGPSPGSLTVTINQEDNSSCPTTKKLVVSVRNQNGAAVTGLGQTNFALRENGQIRTISVNCTVGGSSTASASIAIVIDSGGSLSTTDLANEKTAAKQLVAQLGFSDAIAVFSFDDTVVRRQDFTTNRAAVNQAIDAITIGGGTALHRAVRDAAQALAARSGRKAIVLLTDGQDTVGGVSVDEAIAAARQSASPVFTVGFGGGINTTILTRIATESGGFFSNAVTSANLLQILTAIGQVLSSQCELTYAPANATSGAVVEVTATAFGGTQQGSVSQPVGACTTPAGGTTQPGCSYLVQPLSYSFNTAGGTAGGVASGGGTNNPPVIVTTRSDCRWGALANDPWITIEAGATGLGNGAVSYRVAPNPLAARTGSLIIAGTTHSVQQAAGSSCTFSLSLTNLTFAGSGGFGSVDVTAPATTCTWATERGVPWIIVTAGGGGRGSGRVEFTVGPNASASTRIGTLVIAGITFTVNQGGAGTFGDPQLTDASIVPTATYFPPSLPGGALAQGSFFTIFGIDIGPDPQAQVTAFPLPTILGGVSVVIRQGAVSVSCFMVFASRTQVNGVIPSTAPLGDADMTLTYLGRTGRVVRVRIVRHNFGIFAVSGGSGPGIIQNFISDGERPLNTRSQSARPDQIIIIWGNGGGPISTGDDVAPPANPLPFDYEVLVGGKKAVSIFLGRSGCCSALDLVIVRVPADVPFGCNVPVQVRVENSWSNVVTMAVSQNGGACSDPQNPFSALPQRGGRAGTVFLIRSNTLAEIEPGQAPSAVQADLALGVFANTTAAGDFGFAPLTSLPPTGSCQSSSGNQDVSDIFGGFLPPLNIAGSGQPLDAGVKLTVTNPAGQTMDVPRTDTTANTGPYGALLGGSIPGVITSPSFFSAGTIRVQGAGGRDVGSFDATAVMPNFVNWANRDQITSVERSRGVSVTWSGGSSDQFVIIAGVSSDQKTKATSGFFCFAPSAAGQFIVPPSAMANMPLTSSGGTNVQDTAAALMVGSFSGNFQRFNAAGIDVGVLIPASLEVRTVGVRP